MAIHRSHLGQCLSPESSPGFFCELTFRILAYVFVVVDHRILRISFFETQEPRVFDNKRIQMGSDGGVQWKEMAHWLRQLLSSWFAHVLSMQ
jgi:hypothetical protein